MSSTRRDRRGLPREARSVLLLGLMVFTGTGYLACSGSERTFGGNGGEVKSDAGSGGGSGGATSSGNGGGNNGGNTSGGGATGAGGTTNGGGAGGSSAGGDTSGGGAGGTSGGGANAGGHSGIPDASQDARDDAPTSNAN